MSFECKRARLSALMRSKVESSFRLKLKVRKSGMSNFTDWFRLNFVTKLKLRRNFNPKLKSLFICLKRSKLSMWGNKLWNCFPSSSHWVKVITNQHFRSLLSFRQSGVVTRAVKTKLDGCASLRISWKAIKRLSSMAAAIKAIIRAELLSSSTRDEYDVRKALVYEEKSRFELGESLDNVSSFVIGWKMLNSRAFVQLDSHKHHLKS